MLSTFNDSIVIYNRWYNKLTKNDEWRGRRVEGVSWYGGQMAALRERGLVSADAYTVRIPQEALQGYVSPGAYNPLTEIGEEWTVQSGDIVLKAGACELPSAIALPTEAASLGLPCFTVTGWSDNRRGALGHLKVTGK